MLTLFICERYFWLTRYTESKTEVCNDMKPLIVSHMSDPYRFYCQLDSEAVNTIAEAIDFTYRNDTLGNQYAMVEEYFRPGQYVACFLLQSYLFSCIILFIELFSAYIQVLILYDRVL